jgi:hypothetical protein
MGARESQDLFNERTLALEALPHPHAQHLGVEFGRFVYIVDYEPRVKERFQHLVISLKWLV